MQHTYWTKSFRLNLSDWERLHAAHVLHKELQAKYSLIGKIAYSTLHKELRAKTSQTGRDCMQHTYWTKNCRLKTHTVSSA